MATPSPPQLILNTTLPSFSPFISYYPFAEGDPTLDWDSLFLSLGFPEYSGEPGNGSALHATRAKGAEVEVSFYGSSVSLYGLALAPVTYSTILDGVLTPGSAVNNVLASYEGLQEGMHTVSLVVNGTGGVEGKGALGFEFAVVGSGTGVTGGTITNRTVALSDPSVLLAGQWETPANASAPGAKQTTRLGDSAMLTFNGTSVTLLGSLSPQAGAYYITLNSTSGVVRNWTLNAQSQWDVESAVLFWQGGLQGQAQGNGEVEEWSLWVSNAQSGSVLEVDGFVVTSVEGGSAIPSASQPQTATSTPRLPAGTIVAIVLSITLLLSLLLFFYIRHHRRRAQLHPRMAHLQSRSPVPPDNTPASDPPSQGRRRSFLPSLLSFSPIRPFSMSPPFSLPFTSHGPSASHSSRTSRGLRMTVNGRTYDPDDRQPVSSREGVRWSRNGSAVSLESGEGSGSGSGSEAADEKAGTTAAFGELGVPPPVVTKSGGLLAPPPAAATGKSKLDREREREKERPTSQTVYLDDFVPARQPPPAPSATLPRGNPAQPHPIVTVQDVARSQRAPPLNMLSPLMLPSPVSLPPSSASTSKRGSWLLPNSLAAAIGLTGSDSQNTTPTGPSGPRPLKPRQRGRMPAPSEPPRYAPPPPPPAPAGARAPPKKRAGTAPMLQVAAPSLLLPPQRSNTINSAWTDRTDVSNWRSVSDAVSTRESTYGSSGHGHAPQGSFGGHSAYSAHSMQAEFGEVGPFGVLPPPASEREHQEKERWEGQEREPKMPKTPKTPASPASSVSSGGPPPSAQWSEEHDPSFPLPDPPASASSYYPDSLGPPQQGQQWEGSAAEEPQRRRSRRDSQGRPRAVVGRAVRLLPDIPEGR